MQSGRLGCATAFLALLLVSAPWADASLAAAPVTREPDPWAEPLDDPNVPVSGGLEPEIDVIDRDPSTGSAFRRRGSGSTPSVIR